MGIDSDLVAALQFESADAADWGSTQLETAVIDRVAARQKKVDVMAAMPRQPLAWRLKVLIATVAVWAVLGIVRPGYVRIFFQRLAFGSQHYPSQTVVQTITVNGKTVYDKDKRRSLGARCGGRTRAVRPGGPL